MRSASAALLFMAGALVLGACDSPSHVTAAQPKSPALSVSDAGVTVKPVQMLDECDPATFNAKFGEGVCLSNHHGITVEDFLARLGNTQTVPAWRFSANNFSLALGSTIEARNLGGEKHTFTRVKEFGGGVLDFINVLAGTPDEAPECKVLDDDDFVGPGGTYPQVADQSGVIKFQCCIHPWMRTTVAVR